MKNKVPVIYNGDFGTLGWSPEVWEPNWQGTFSKEGVRNFVKTLAENGVDTLLMNPNTQVAWYPSKVWPSILDNYTRDNSKNLISAAWDHRFGIDYKQKPLNYVRCILNTYLDLVEKNVDWMEELTGACEDYNIGLWASIRMNDMHYVGPGKKNYLMAPIYEKNHLKGITHTGRFNEYYKALDYSKKEVRNYYFALIKELVEDYNCKGIELDWTRNAACIEYPATSKDTIIIDQWLTMIKEYLSNMGAKNNCRYTLGMRVLSNVEIYKNIGIDVIENAKNKILDFICPSNFVSCTWDFDYDSLRQLTENNCDIYGSTEVVCNKLPCKPDFSNYYKTEELENTNLGDLRDIAGSKSYFYGYAASILSKDVDALEIYNFFIADARHLKDMKSDYALLNNITDIDFLKRKTKFYTLTTAGGGCNYPPFEMVAKAPVKMLPFRQYSFNISMLKEDNMEYELVIQVVTKKEITDQKFGVSFNSSPVQYNSKKTSKLVLPCQPFGSHTDENIAYNFSFESIAIKNGWNCIKVYNDLVKEGLLIKSVEVAVIFKELQ